MKLATFFDGTEKLGILVSEDELIDLSSDEKIANMDMIAAITGGAEFLERAEKVAQHAPKLAVRDVKLMAPVPRPRKILAVGLNYLDHIAEAEKLGVTIPKVPMVFNKQVTSVAGPFDDVHLPKVSDQLDYEGEFAIVIGRRCRNVAKQDAEKFIFGFVALNDVSVRDWQMACQTFTMGKSFDTHCPFGPSILTIDEVGVAPALQLKMSINGELRQQAVTDKLKFNCADLIAYLSTAFTLEPGDIIPTGTPGGVAGAMEQPKWLKAGDIMRLEIEQIGHIENRIVKEPDDFLSNATPK